MRSLKKLILVLTVLSLSLAVLSIFSPIIAFIASQYNYAPIEYFTLNDPIVIIGILSITLLIVALVLILLSLKSFSRFSKMHKVPINSILNSIGGCIFVFTPYFFYYITGSFYSSLFFIDYKFSIGFYLMLWAGGFAITAGIFRVIRQIFYKKQEP